MTEFVTRAGIEADPQLAAFIESDVLGPLGRDVDAFWKGFADLLGRFGPRNADLLAKREDLQAKIQNADEQLKALEASPPPLDDAREGVRLEERVAVCVDNRGVMRAASMA